MGVKSSPFVLVVSLVTCKRFTLATRSRYKRMYQRASARHIGDSCGGFNKHDNNNKREARRAARGNYAASAVAEIAIDRIALFSWFIHQTRGSPVIAVAVPCPYSIP